MGKGAALREGAAACPRPPPLRVFTMPAHGSFSLAKHETTLRLPHPKLDNVCGNGRLIFHEGGERLGRARLRAKRQHLGFLARTLLLCRRLWGI